jgi:hypothetical protein
LDFLERNELVVDIDMALVAEEEGEEEEEDEMD